MMTLRASKKSCLPGHSSPGILEKEILTFINCFLENKIKKKHCSVHTKFYPVSENDLHKKARSSWCFTCKYYIYYGQMKKK